MAGREFSVTFKIQGELAGNFQAAMAAAQKSMQALAHGAQSASALSKAGIDKLAANLEKLKGLAATAERFQQVKAGLIETNAAANAANRQAAQLKTPYDEAARAVDALTAKLKELAAAQTKQEKQVEVERQILKSARDVRREYQTQIKGKNEQLRATKSPTVRLQLVQEAAQLKGMVAAGDRLIETHTALFQQAKTSLAELKKQIAAVKVERSEALKEYDARKKTYTEAQGKAKDLTQAMPGKIKILQDLGGKLRESGFDVGRFAADSATLKTRIDLTQRALTQQQTNLQTQQEMMARLQQSQERLKETAKARAAEAAQEAAIDLKIRRAKARDQVLGEWAKVNGADATASIGQALTPLKDAVANMQQLTNLTRRMESDVNLQAKQAEMLSAKLPKMTREKLSDDPLKRLEQEHAQILRNAAEYQRISKLQGQTRQMHATVNKTTARLAANLKNQQAAVSQFKTQLEGLKTTYSKIAENLNTSQRAAVTAKIEQLSKAYARAQQELKASESRFNISRGSGQALKGALNEQAAALAKLKSELAAAGFSTDNFALSQSRLRSAVTAATSALREQAAATPEGRRQHAEEASANFNNAYQNFQDIRSAASAAMAPFTSSVEVAKDFERQMSVVKSLTQMDNLRAGRLEQVNAEMRELTEQAERLGLSTQFTATQVAQGQTYLAYAGWNKEQIVSAMPHMLDLATSAGMQDLGRASDILTDIMSAFKLPAQDAGRVSDVLAYTFTHSNQNLEQLYETMKYAAPIARMFGSSIEESAAITKFMADAGIKGSMAGTSMRSIMTRLVAPPKTASKAMEENGISLADANKEWLNANEIAENFGITLKEGLSPGQQMAAVIRQINENMGDLDSHEKLGVFKAITGLYALSGAANLFETGGEMVDDAKNPGQQITRLEKFTRDLEESQGAAEQTANVMRDNYWGATVALSSALEGVQTQIGQALTPTLQSAAEAITPLVTGFGEFLKENPGVVQGAAAITASLATLAVSATGLAAVVAGFKFVSAQLNIFTPAITAAVPRIVALGEALAKLATVGAWSSVFSGVTSKLSKLGAAISGLSFAKIISGVQSLGAAFLGLGGKIFGALRALTLFAFSPVGVALIGLSLVALAIYKNWDKVSAAFSAAAKIFGGSFSGAAQSASAALSNLGAAFNNLSNALGQGNFGDMLAKGFIVAVNVIIGVISTLVNFLSNAFSSIVNMVAGIADVFSHLADRDFKGAWEAAQKYGDIVSESLKKTFEAIPDGIKKTGAAIDESLKAYDKATEIQRQAAITQQQQEIHNNWREGLSAQGKDPDVIEAQINERAAMIKKGFIKKGENGFYGLPTEGERAAYHKYLAEVEQEKQTRINSANEKTRLQGQELNVATTEVYDKDDGWRVRLTSLPKDMRQIQNAAEGGAYQRHALDAATQKSIVAAQKSAETAPKIPEFQAPKPVTLPQTTQGTNAQIPTNTPIYSQKPPETPQLNWGRALETQTQAIKNSTTAIQHGLPKTYTPGAQAGVDLPKTTPVKIEIPKIEAPKLDLPKIDALKFPTQQPFQSAPPQVLPKTESPELFGALENIIFTKAAASEKLPDISPQITSLGAAAENSAQNFTAANSNFSNFNESTALSNESLSAIVNSTEAFGEKLLSMANSTAETTEKMAQVQAPVEEATNSLNEIPATVQETAANVQNVNEIFSQVSQSISESVSSFNESISTATQGLTESLTTAGTSINESFAQVVTSIQAANDIFTQTSATIQTVNAESQQLTANLTANNAAVQQDSAAMQQNSAAAQAAAASLTALSGAAQNAAGGVNSLGSASSGAAGSVSALGSAASSAVAAMNSAAASISAAAANVGSPAQNYNGGIYHQGAFLTWFAEKSPEAAIPLDGSDRAINLWQQAGSMLGVYPYSEQSATFTAAPQLKPAENYSGGIYAQGGREISNNAAVRQRLANRRVAQVQAYRQAAIEQGTLNTGELTKIDPKIIEQSTPKIETAAPKIEQATPKIETPAPVSQSSNLGSREVPAAVANTPEVRERLMQRRLEQIQPYIDAAKEQGLINSGKPVVLNQAAADLAKSTENLDKASTSLAVVEKAAENAPAEKESPSQEKESPQKKESAPRQNILQRWGNTAGDFFFKLFHPRKYEAKQRGYETDKFGNIIGLNGLPDNVITANDDIKVARDKREAQLKEFQTKGKQPPKSDKPKTAPLGEVLKYLPQSKVPDWALNPTPTFPTPNKKPSLLEEFFTPDWVKRQRQMQTTLDISRERNLSDKVKQSKSYQALTGTRDISNLPQSMLAPQQLSGRGVIDNLLRGNWKGAISAGVEMYRRRQEIKAREPILNPPPLSERVPQIFRTSTPPFVNVPATSADSQQQIFRTSTPPFVNAPQPARKQSALEKGAESVSNYFYKIFHPRKYAAKQLGYETDKLGNIKGLDGVPDNVITTNDDKRVARSKKTAQVHEWIKQQREGTFKGAESESPRKKNFLEKGLEVAGKFLGGSFKGKRNAFADWDFSQGIKPNLARAVFNMFGGNQNGEHPGVKSPFGVKFPMEKNIISTQKNAPSIGKIVEDIFTPQSVKSQRAMQANLDFSRKINLPDNVKQSKSYQELNAKRPIRETTSMLAPRQLSGMGVVDNLLKGNWKGALSSGVEMYRRSREIKYGREIGYEIPKSGGFPFKTTTPPFVGNTGAQIGNLPIPAVNLSEGANTAAAFAKAESDSAAGDSFARVDKSSAPADQSFSMPPITLNLTMTINGNANQQEVENGVKQAIPVMQDSFEEQFARWQHELQRRSIL